MSYPKSKPAILIPPNFSLPVAAVPVEAGPVVVLTAVEVALEVGEAVVAPAVPGRPKCPSGG